MIAAAWAPGSIGNVGPGFDVLGLAVDGIGDRVSVELTRGESRVVSISGRDAELIPRDAARNCAVVAATSYLRPYHYGALVTIEKGLALAGGMGGSAASSVAGAYAAALALGQAPPLHDVIAAALEGESAIGSHHLDNIAASAVGGLALSRSADPIDVIRLPVQAEWWIALVTPRIRIQTKDARAIVPDHCDRATLVQQMANTAAVVHAFASADGELLRRALVDRYAEPYRAPLIPRFAEVKCAAIENGALGCSISGSGPTLFALAADEDTARRCALAMQKAFAEVQSSMHVGAIASEGVRGVSPGKVDRP